MEGRRREDKAHGEGYGGVCRHGREAAGSAEAAGGSGQVSGLASGGLACTTRDIE
jgi:hypothetical protein